jgi:hypothetical protein
VSHDILSVVHIYGRSYSGRTAVHQAAGHVDALIAALDEVDYISDKEE